MSIFQKMITTGKVNKLRKEIATIEQKRSRSQAALVQCILSHTEPKNEDVEFFNQYTAQINELRDEMHRLKSALDAENNK